MAELPAELGQKVAGSCGRVETVSLADVENDARSGLQRPAATGWPTLTGTEFQVDWALTLRAEAIAEIRERLAVRSDGPMKRAAAALWTEVALRQTDARWWISHRDNLTVALQTALTDADRVRLHRIQKNEVPLAAHPEDGVAGAVPDSCLRGSQGDQSLDTIGTFAEPA